MRITNRTRNTTLGANVKLASTWFGRLRGFIGCPEPKHGEGILLHPCDAVHTFWMSFDLDILFLNEKGQVLQVVRSLKPWKKTKRVEGAHYALEVPVGTVDSSGTRVGDELSWRGPSPYTISVLSSNREEELSTASEHRRSAV